jgi:hypothetical protein
MSREENWSYGIIEEDKLKLQPLLDALRRLRQRGLTAGMVAATFHCQRVLPLMQRRLQIDEMTPEASLEGSRMSHESLPLDEVTRRARWVVGSFKQEDIDRVPMRPIQGFEPLVSVVFDSLGSFCFLIPSTKLVEASVQDLSAVKESRPPVPEDQASREARRLSAAQKKEEKDVAKKRQVKTALEHEALKSAATNRASRVSRSRNLPPRWSQGRMKTAATTTPGHGMISRLFWRTSPTCGPYWSPLGVDLPGIEGSLTAHRGGRRASRGKGPNGSFREGIYLAWGPAGRSVAPRPRAQSPRTLPVGGAMASASEARAPSTGVRTRGQIASSAQRSSGAPSARAPRSTRPTGGSTEPRRGPHRCRRVARGGRSLGP